MSYQNGLSRNSIEMSRFQFAPPHVSCIKPTKDRVAKIQGDLAKFMPAELGITTLKLRFLPSIASSILH
jgi:hypothetical protein